MNLTFKLLLLFVLSNGCDLKTNTIPVNSSQTENKTTVKENPDTIVVSRMIPSEISGSDYMEKEYFIVISEDTSGFSCIISKNKIKGNLSIRCDFSRYRKVSDPFSLEDSAAVSESGSEKSKLYFVPKYKEQVNELKLILEQAAKGLDLSKLNYFTFGMNSFNSFSQNITKQYISLYGEHFRNDSNEKVVDLIKKSTLVVDLNRILLPYSLIINEISLDGLAYYAANDTSYKNGTLSSASKKIIDGMVIFTTGSVPAASE